MASGDGEDVMRPGMGWGMVCRGEETTRRESTTPASDPAVGCERLLRLGLRLGVQLSSGAAKAEAAGEDPAAWERVLAEYRENQHALHALGAELRPAAGGGENRRTGPGLRAEVEQRLAA